MAYTNDEVRKTGMALESRFRKAADFEAAYPLVYLVRFMQKNGLSEDDCGKAVSLIEDCDEDIARLIDQTLDCVQDDMPIENAIEYINRIDVDLLDAYLQQGPVSSGINGVDFSTPEGVSRLALAILNIQEGEKVIDFGSGSGNFLELAAAECPKADFWGVEINPATFALAKMRSTLSDSGINYARNDMFDFYDDKAGALSVDKAFSNYPWGMRTSALHRFSRTIEKTLQRWGCCGRSSSADWVYNRLLVDSLKKDGIAVAIMANGACSNGADRSMREHFLKNGYVKAVVALPKDVFAPRIMFPTSLIVLCAGGSQSVRFVDATDLGTAERRSSLIDDFAVREIMSRLEIDSEKSVSKTLDEVAAHDYDLFAKRYLEKEIEVPNAVELGSVAVIKRGANIRAPELDTLACGRDTGICYLSLGNMSDGYIDGDLLNLSMLDPKYEKYCVCDGDLLISKTGAPFKVAVAEVPEGHRVIASGNIYVVSVDREKVDPYYLAAFFSSPSGKEALVRKIVGTKIPSLPIKALSSVQVPLESMERQKAVSSAFIAKIDEIKALKQCLFQVRQEAADVFAKLG